MRQKRVLRIELSRGTGGSVYVGVSPSDCVLSIKHKLETLTGIPVLSQTLYHAATQLSDSTPLHEFCGTTPVTNLALHVPIRGGATNKPGPSTGFDNINFFDVTQQECFETLDFSAQAPDYMIVYKGLSLEAKCENSNCESFRNSHSVFVRKGMCSEYNGYCSIRRVIEDMICPACYLLIPSSNWKNIILTNCTARINWKLTDTRKGETELTVSHDKFIRAKTACQVMEYAYLDVTLK